MHAKMLKRKRRDVTFGSGTLIDTISERCDSIDVPVGEDYTCTVLDEDEIKTVSAPVELKWDFSQ